MKKTLVFAALASVALVGCTKNVEVANNDLNEITFETPVLAPATKADEITGTTFPDTVDFAVFAWYSATKIKETDAAGSLYMKDVTVNYDSTKDDTTDGKGAWKPASVYFWPKNGYLAFDAYSPSSVAATCDATTGIAFSDFVAPISYDDQIDLLYSTRVINKQSSVEEDTNDTYDGVNIPFNHALSVVRVFVKASTDTDANLIKVKSVKFMNIKNQGDFSQAKWTPEGTDVNLVIGEAANATSSTAISTAEEQYGNNHIVLPQKFTGNSAVLEIRYYILGQGDVEPLEQVATLNLASQSAVGAENHTGSWLMGKRYNYHITFGLNEIYFAPSITDWVDYDVTVPTID